MLKCFLLHGAQSRILSAMALLFKVDYPCVVLAAHNLALVVVFALGGTFFSQWGQKAIHVLALIYLQVLINQGRQRVLLATLGRPR